MFRPNQDEINKAIRKDVEKRAVQAALAVEAEAGKDKSNVMQAIIAKFAGIFAKKADQNADVREVQEVPAVELNPKRANS